MQFTVPGRRGRFGGPGPAARSHRLGGPDRSGGAAGRGRARAFGRALAGSLAGCAAATAVGLPLGAGAAAADSGTTPAVATSATRTISTPFSGHGCPANLADELASTGSVRQLVTMNTTGYSSSYGLVTTWLKQGPCWHRVSGPWPARLGWNGISDRKVEGDGTTPSGAYRIGPVMYGNSPNPGVHFPYHRLVCGDWWDEDPSSRWYNSFQHVACGSYPAWTGGDSEALWTETTAYESFAWIEYNTDPVVPGKGSAIFLHDGITAPTTGCVSLAPSELNSVLDWLQPADAPLMVMGTDGEIRGF